MKTRKGVSEYSITLIKLATRRLKCKWRLIQLPLKSIPNKNTGEKASSLIVKSQSHITSIFVDFSLSVLNLTAT